MNLSILNWHQFQDLQYYLCFFLGQCLFILKRASSAIRNPNTTIKNRREYIYCNWDIILTRTALESPIFFIWRHYSLAQIIAVFGVPLPSWIPSGMMASESGPLMFFVLGYAADSILDWLSMWKRIPDWLKGWLRENVPVLPALQQKAEQIQHLEVAQDEIQQAKNSIIPSKP